MKAPKLILTAFFATIVLNAFTQNQFTDTSATMVSYWKKGDEKRYNIQFKETKVENGKKTVDTSSYQVVLKVLDEKPDSYTIQWEYPGTVCTDARCIKTSGFQWLLPGVKIIYSTTETGAFKQLENYTEVKQHLDRYFNIIQQNIEKDTVKAGIMGALFKMLSSREIIEQVVLKDIALLHKCYGVEYYSHNPQTSDIELPNFLGGEPFPALLSVYYYPGKTTALTLSVGLRMDINEDKALPLMVDGLMRLLKKNGKTELSADKIKQEIKNGGYKIKIDDESGFEFYKQSGWIKTGFNKRTMTIMDMVKTSEIMIREN
jgi:hypothetical protein